MALEIIEKLTTLLEEDGQDATLAMIINAAGSTPRKAGAKMIVTANRDTYGTIGGGLGEEIIIRECLKTLETKKSFTHRINLTNDIASTEGLICGGVMDVFVDYISNADKYTLELLTRYTQSARNHEKPVLVTLTGIKGEGYPVAPGRKTVILANGSLAGDLGAEVLNNLAASAVGSLGKGINPELVTLPLDHDRQVEFFIEPSIITPEVLILGGGHIALPLVNIASLLGFKVTVIDDRPEFANADRFPRADEIICDNFESALEGLDIGPNTYAIIVTRGHQYDRNCLRKIIACPAAYIGMIGSRRKVTAIMNQLAQDGISHEKLAAVFSPIGLNIGAETPEEIAVSIMAEVISIYRGSRVAIAGC